MTTDCFTDAEKQAINDDFEDLLRRAYRSQSPDEQAMLRKAFTVAYQAHNCVRRKTKEPFIHHPIEVARIVALEMGLDTTAITAALMHDVVEDSSDFSVADLENMFGKGVGAIVDGLTKITDVYDAKQNLQAETFRKLLLTIPENIRVVFIKLADRLHNMRTMYGMPSHKQRIKAGETLYVYSPIAHRIGLFDIKKELEDLSFKYYNPEEYQRLISIIEKNKRLRENVIDEFAEPIVDKLQQKNISFKVEKATKSLYTTWTKMKEKGISFDELHNFFSLLIIFEPNDTMQEREQSYLIYAYLTELYMPKNDTLRDWILQPQSSGFKALIVDVMGKRGEWFEVQIMSRHMYEISKRGEFVDELDNGELNERNRWIRNMSETLRNPNASATELLEMVKLDLYTSEIYVFTPMGKIITLPKGATALDFAYMLHSDLGNHCMAANVNNTTVDRKYVLKTADQVHILTSDNTRPEKEWLDFVVTSNARNRLKEYFRHVRRENIENGRRIYHDTTHDMPRDTVEKMQDEALKTLKCKDREHLFEKLGEGIISPSDLAKAFKPKSSYSWNQLLVWRSNGNANNNQQPASVFAAGKLFLIDERYDDSNFSLSTCCNPIAGDDAIAYQSESAMIFIHQRKCQETKRLYSEQSKRVTDVEWGQHKFKQFKARVRLKGFDRKGLLNDITNVIYEQYDVNMSHVTINTGESLFEGIIDLMVHNLDDFNRLKAQLRKIKGINAVHRVEHW